MRVDPNQSAKETLLLLLYMGALKPSRKTELQKVLFFAELDLVEDGFASPGFEYFRYDYGPFSRELYVHLDRLREAGLVNQSNIKLTKSGLDAANDFFEAVPQTPENTQIIDAILDWIDKLGGKTASQLEDFAYGVKLLPVDATSDEEPRTIEEIEHHRTLVNPPLQNQGGKTFAFGDEELRMFRDLLTRTPERREKICTVVDPDEVPLDSVG